MCCLFYVETTPFTFDTAWKEVMITHWLAMSTSLWLSCINFVKHTRWEKIEERSCGTDLCMQQRRDGPASSPFLSLAQTDNGNLACIFVKKLSRIWSVRKLYIWVKKEMWEFLAVSWLTRLKPAQIIRGLSIERERVQHCVYQQSPIVCTTRGVLNEVVPMI